MAIILSSIDFNETQVLVFVVMIHHVGNSFSTQTVSSAYFNSMLNMAKEAAVGVLSFLVL